MMQLAKPVIKRVLGPRFQVWRPYFKWGKTRAEAVANFTGVYSGRAVEWDVPEHAHCVATETRGPGRGEIFGKTIYSAISAGTEIAFFQQKQNTSNSFPSIPGYSLSGRVVAVGPGVTKVKPGDLVAAKSGHRSYFRCQQDDVFEVPDGVGAKEAALFYIGAISTHGVWSANIGPTDKVAVIGRGVIGQLTAQIARASGTNYVGVFARSAREDSCSSFVDEQFAEQDDGWRQLAAAQPTVIIESSGSVDALAKSIDCIAPGGRVILLSSYRDSFPAFDLNDCAKRSVQLIGAHIDTLPRDQSDKSYGAACEEFLHLIAEGRINVVPLTQLLVSPYEAGVFYRDLATGASQSRIALFDWQTLPDTERLDKISFNTLPDPEIQRASTMFPATPYWELTATENSR